MTTIKLSGGFLGNEKMLVRCNLSRAESPVQANYCNGQGGDEWEGTQYQCADTRHSLAGLICIANELARAACEVPEDCEDEPEWTQLFDKQEAIDIIVEIARDIMEKRDGNESTIRNHAKAYTNWQLACDSLSPQEVSDAIREGIVSVQCDD